MWKGAVCLEANTRTTTLDVAVVKCIILFRECNVSAELPAVAPSHWDAHSSSLLLCTISHSLLPFLPLWLTRCHTQCTLETGCHLLLLQNAHINAARCFTCLLYLFFSFCVRLYSYFCVCVYLFLFYFAFSSVESSAWPTFLTFLTSSFVLFLFCFDCVYFFSLATQWHAVSPPFPA